MLRLLACSVAVLVVAAAGRSAPVPKEDGKELRKRLTEAGDLFAASEAAAGDEKKDLRRQFNDTLRRAAPLLPEVVPVQGEPRAYTKLTLNANGEKAGAFRFRAPDAKADWDLNWEFVYPTGSGFSKWFILPREGTMTGFTTFTPSNNYQEDGAGLPPKNRRIVQPLTGGHVKPGAEYVIWFTFKDDKPVDFHIRVGLTPAPAP